MNLFGDKRDSLFDVWSIEHFVSGLTIGSILLCIMAKHFLTPAVKEAMANPYQKSNPFFTDRQFLFNYFMIIALIAYLWEVLEFYMEAGYTNNDKITYWFQGVEYWLNRVVTDPAMVVLGSWCALKLRSSIARWSGRSFSATWVGVHVFVFPHCMYLQEIAYNALPDSDKLHITFYGAIDVCSKLISGLWV